MALVVQLLITLLNLTGQSARVIWANNCEVFTLWENLGTFKMEFHSVRFVARGTFLRSNQDMCISKALHACSERAISGKK